MIVKTDRNFMNQKKFITLIVSMVLSLASIPQLVVYPFSGSFRNNDTNVENWGTGILRNCFENHVLIDAIANGTVEAVRDAAYEASKNKGEKTYSTKYLDSSYEFELINDALKQLAYERDLGIVTAKLTVLQEQLHFLETLKNANVSKDLRDALLSNIVSNSAMVAFMCRQVDTVGIDVINDMARIVVRFLSADISCLEKNNDDSKTQGSRKRLSQSLEFYKKDIIPVLKNINTDMRKKLQKEFETKYNNASCAETVPSSNIRCTQLAEFLEIVKK
jgi:hypothetical protein